MKYLTTTGFLSDGANLTGLKASSSTFPNGIDAGLARILLQQRMVTVAVSDPRNRRLDQLVSIVADSRKEPQIAIAAIWRSCRCLNWSCQLAEQRHAQVRSWFGVACQCAEGPCSGLRLALSPSGIRRHENKGASVRILNLLAQDQVAVAQVSSSGHLGRACLTRISTL